jgi:prepilin-type processing-associated H-X9-DG protein
MFEGFRSAKARPFAERAKGDLTLTPAHATRETRNLNHARTINNPEAHAEDYWIRHPGGANTLFGDGSVHFLKSAINPIPWRAMATRAFGEVISSDSN